MLQVKAGEIGGVKGLEQWLAFPRIPVPWGRTARAGKARSNQTPGT
jgi:hypothetical protein